MPGQTLFFAMFLGSLVTASNASSAEYGTVEQAKTMLDRAVVEMKADKLGAIKKFNHNVWPFRDRDLYVFCFNGQDGRFTAHEAFIGSDVRDLRDRTGRRFGVEMYNSAQEDRIAEVAFVSPVPGSTRQAIKHSYVTRLGDQVCGVSAYRDAAH